MAEDNEPAIKITLTAIYDRVVSVERQVAEVAKDLPSHMTITKQKQEEYETRLENHGSRLSTLDTRLSAAETKVTILETKQVPRAPWFSVVGGIVSVITGLGSLITLLAVLSQLGNLTQ